MRVWAELRTALAGVDPGLERLLLAAVASASMVLAVAVTAVVRARTGQPVTLLIFAAALAMISNLAVNEPDLPRRRVTTALMVFPAAAAIVAGTLLAPYRVAADLVFVAVTAAAVYVRRFGPRGFALGMAGFMPYFFTQFLGARVAELPWLLLAAAVGLGATLLLRGYVFAERDDRTLARLLRAFRARVHGLVVAAAGLLAVAGGPEDRVDAALQEARRRRARLNAAALLVADRLERVDDRGDGGDGRGDGRGNDGDAARVEELGQQTLDVELAAERLAIAIRRLAEVGGPRGADRDALLEGLRALGAATATGTPHAMVPALVAEARRPVAELIEGTTGYEDRTQRVAFAVHRLANALENAQVRAQEAAGVATGPLAGGGPAAAGPQQGDPAAVPGTTATRGGTAEDRAGAHEPPGTPESAEAPELGEPDRARTLSVTTRQAVQAGTAVGLAIVLGELVSPARWYWAAIAAFVVFAGTNSRGDILSRGWQRIVGTAAGVAAGMGLAVLVGDRVPLTLLALIGCLFLALYLVRISQALMAFWITAVLALMYGLIGQFSLEVLVLRIAETAVGAVAGMLAAFLVLPRRTRDAHAEARDELLQDADAVVAAAADRLLGREPATPPVELARDMDEALRTLRDRTAPLIGPWRRASDRYRDTVQVLAGVDHYARSLARLSDTVHAPDWAPLLEPAVERVRANLDALRGDRADGDDGDPGARVHSAEDLVDAAEAWAARRDDPQHRRDLLEAARLLRRLDQSAVALAGAPLTGDSALSRR